MANPRPTPPRPSPDHPWRGKNQINLHHDKLNKTYGRLSINGHSVSRAMKSLNFPDDLNALLDEIGVVAPRSETYCDSSEAPVPLREREMVVRDKHGRSAVIHNGQTIGWVEPAGGGCWRAVSIHGDHDLCHTRKEAISRVHEMLA